MWQVWGLVGAEMLLWGRIKDSSKGLGGSEDLRIPWDALGEMIPSPWSASERWHCLSWYKGARGHHFSHLPLSIN